MSDAVCVYGLWHLGCVIAGSLAAAGHHVLGLDQDAGRIAALRRGRAPIQEPGLDDLLRAGMDSGRLTFTSDPGLALARARVLWVTFDTPIDDHDSGDHEWVRGRLEAVRRDVRPHTLVLVSSQVPVGFTAALEGAWRDDPTIQFAYSPENVRLGRALETFRKPERVVVGVGIGTERRRIEELFTPLTRHIDWMSLNAAEMTKHAINGFLAVSVAYANELARIAERVGADAAEVERGLRGDARVGAAPYLSPGSPIAGGTLLRDITYLRLTAAAQGVTAPLVGAVELSNEAHVEWIRGRVRELLVGVDSPRVALLGLAYKPDTDTLRGSVALELGGWLVGVGVSVCAFDPLVRQLPEGSGAIALAPSLGEALAGADVAVVATSWPEFRSLTADELSRQMRRPAVVDQAGFLGHLADDPRIAYIRVGRPRDTHSQ